MKNVSYLPLPNFVEIVITDDLAPRELTTTSFVVPVLDNGAIVFANNQTRGVEIAGGHIEFGETVETAASRETLEETGCEIVALRPIGYLKLVSQGEAPDGWKYPHPVSYQQFFTARVTRINHFVANEECAEPTFLEPNTSAKFPERPWIAPFVKRAREIHPTKRVTYASRSNAHRAAREACRKALGRFFCAFEGPDYAIHPDSGPWGLGYGKYGMDRFWFELRGPALEASRGDT